MYKVYKTIYLLFVGYFLVVLEEVICFTIKVWLINYFSIVYMFNTVVNTFYSNKSFSNKK